MTHQLQDAFYIATHAAVRRNGRLEILPASQPNALEAEFIMLKDARIYFQGNAVALCASTDAYLKAFLSGWVPSLVG